MKRSIQEYVELAIFALIAAFLATAFIWLAGWGVTGLGHLLRLLANLLWWLLKFILPIALVLIAGYVIYRVIRSRGNNQPQSAPATVVSGNSSAPSTATSTATATTEAASDAAETAQDNAAKGDNAATGDESKDS